MTDGSPTVVCWGSQFGFLGITISTQWRAAMAMYMLGYITYGVTLVFYASIFPRLARNTPRTKAAREKLDQGTIDSEQYETVEMLERNRLSNISTAHSNCTSYLQCSRRALTNAGGYLLTLALNLSLLLPLANNSKVDNVSIEASLVPLLILWQYTLAFTNVYWIVCAIPWFLLQKDRRGPPFPKGSHWFTVTMIVGLPHATADPRPEDRMEANHCGPDAVQKTSVSVADVLPLMRE